MSDSERRTPPKWWQDQRLLDRESETVKAIMRGDYGGYVLAPSAEPTAPPKTPEQIQVLKDKATDLATRVWTAMAFVP
jgi:hypothetical protein